MWTHTWMSFTSHIFTSLPLVHTQNPDFLRQHLWLSFLLIRESPHSGNLHTPRLPNSNFSGFPNSADSLFHGFADSWLQVFTGSRPQELRRFKVQIFTGSRLRSFAGSRFEIFASSRLQSFAGWRFVKTHFTNFVKLDVSRWQIFLNSSTVSFIHGKHD
jgi:hypothetical protein